MFSNPFIFVLCLQLFTLVPITMTASKVDNSPDKQPVAYQLRQQRGPPRFEAHPLYLDLYMPAAMQILAHLTEILKFEIRAAATPSTTPPPLSSTISTTTTTTQETPTIPQVTSPLTTTVLSAGSVFSPTPAITTTYNRYLKKVLETDATSGPNYFERYFGRALLRNDLKSSIPSTTPSVFDEESLHPDKISDEIGSGSVKGASPIVALIDLAAALGPGLLDVMRVSVKNDEDGTFVGNLDDGELSLQRLESFDRDFGGGFSRSNDDNESNNGFGGEGNGSAGNGGDEAIFTGDLFRMQLWRGRNQPPIKAYLFLLSLYDMFNKESKKLGLNKYNGYSLTVLDDLAKSSSSTSAYQLKFIMCKIISRGETKNASVLKKINELINELSKESGYMIDSLESLPPLRFKE